MLSFLRNRTQFTEGQRTPNSASSNITYCGRSKCCPNQSRGF